MKRMLVKAVVFLFLFSASAGGSWYFSQMHQPETEDEQDLLGSASAASANISESIYRPDELKQVYRPKDLGPEAILSLSRRLEEREQSIIEKEDALKRQMYQANMVLDDTQREQQELNSFQAMLENEIGRAQSILQEINVRQQELNATKQTMEEMSKETNPETNSDVGVDEVDTKQVSRIAKYYAEMPEESAASLLKQMCDGGRLDFAAQIVGTLEQKIATKILVALNDDVLVNQLLEKVKDKPPAEKNQSNSRRK